MIWNLVSQTQGSLDQKEVSLLRFLIHDHAAFILKVMRSHKEMCVSSLSLKGSRNRVEP